MYTIEKNVPVRTGGGARGSKYPWAEMEVGDSILVPLSDGQTHARLQRQIYNNSRDWLSRNRPGLTIRTTREGEAVRVWLVWAVVDEDNLADRQSNAMYALCTVYDVPDEQQQAIAERIEELIAEVVPMPVEDDDEA